MSTPYAFGTDQRELDRLTLQGAFYHALTRDFLIEAGLPACRNVLEIGCGVGEVTRILQELMPDDGRITVTDVDPRMVAVTESRRAAGRVRVVGQAVAVDQLQAPSPLYDAVVARLVLMYLPDPVATLARLRKLVKPGAVVAVQEADHRSYLTTNPPSELYEHYKKQLDAASAARGIRSSLGLLLRGMFLEAGFHNPVETAKARQDRGPESPVYEVVAGPYVALTVPGDPDEKARAVQRVAAELRHEAVTRNLTVFSSRLIGVYARV